ncbi:MAG: ribbon-helix-helix protein, CopG family [Proteobacteria bacterium]|nr:ribbon-helix-helix protein, CopG family [Burkholderiales bacterium]
MRNANSETRVITSHVPTSMADQVDVLAARLDRPRGWIVKQALADFIALEERRHRMTLDAITDVDAGRVVDHTDVDLWIDSLGTKKPLPPPA